MVRVASPVPVLAVATASETGAVARDRGPVRPAIVSATGGRICRRAQPPPALRPGRAGRLAGRPREEQPSLHSNERGAKGVDEHRADGQP
jgi:hypothetical protein